ncbi:arginine--tRNA ligase, partial [Patescibacteria group bacterium]|nr:arginine--tRNA ligase [Patescibacteria group bacterium]
MRYFRILTLYMVTAELHRILEGIVGDLGANVSFSVEYAPAHAHADFATNAALAAAKVLGKNPQEVAKEISERLVKESVPFIEAVSVAGPGFINISLTPAFFADTVARAQADAEEWGKNAGREGERIMVEHTQPNPFKPFHIGHLMSNTIGESIVRLMRFSGATVTAVNYQGDVGLHIAKAMWGLQKAGKDASDVAAIGEAYVAGNNA